ncbi:hypothetical protein NDU88_001654 [Pleurodeles waltl]|uniref:Uncharacterized protein n=1 Tax=Pleurodeles waltl TaxID=8319 RepID=A0AAV7P4U1_PLEWA|nr:hypothetical protein NDU88_001654 [Pleurodeles waltl]
MTFREPQRVAIKFPPPRLLACFIKVAADTPRGLLSGHAPVQGPDHVHSSQAGEPLSRGSLSPGLSPGPRVQHLIVRPSEDQRRTPASSLSLSRGAPGFSSPQALQPRTRRPRRWRPRQRAGSNAEAHPGAVSPAAILGDPSTRSHPALTALTARTEPAPAPEASPRPGSSRGRPGQHGRPLDGGF